jgi:isoquinoline 1-oxidoreductase beta subunit
VTANRVDLWHPAAMVCRRSSSPPRRTGVPAENIHFHQTLVGGSFGRRVNCDDVRMVLAVAKKFPGTPIHVIWSREETFRQGSTATCTPRACAPHSDPTACREALISHVAAWKPVMFGMSDAVYVKGSIPNVRIETSNVETHILTDSTVAPATTRIASSSNASSMNAPASRHRSARVPPAVVGQVAGRRLEKMPGRRGASRPAGDRHCRRAMAAALPSAISAARRAARGHDGGRGCDRGSHAAGELRVHALDIAFDCGQVLNMDAVRSQLEGPRVRHEHGLNEEITIENGRVVEGNFDRYPMLRLADVPRINVTTR